MVKKTKGVAVGRLSTMKCAWIRVACIMTSITERTKGLGVVHENEAFLGGYHNPDYD